MLLVVGDKLALYAGTFSTGAEVFGSAETEALIEVVVTSLGAGFSTILATGSTGDLEGCSLSFDFPPIPFVCISFTIDERKIAAFCKRIPWQLVLTALFLH